MKILIPVDFSEHSRAAVAYGCRIAEQNGQEIDLVHIFTAHSNLYANRNIDPERVDPEVETAKKNMATLLESVSTAHPGLAFRDFFRDGNLYEEISKMTAAYAYDAVVMGTKGSAGLEAVFLGSNTYDVILNSKTPVLAVPKEAVPFKKDRVGLLCNFKEGEIQVLQQAMALLGKDFELVLIHVDRDDVGTDALDGRFRDWMAEIAEKTGIQNITHTVKPRELYDRTADNLSDAIGQVIIAQRIDLLLVTKSRKSIFRRLVDENIVKKLAFEVSIPKFFARVGDI